MRLFENFPKIDENSEGKIIVIMVNPTKKIVTIPIRLEIFDMK